MTARPAIAAEMAAAILLVRALIRDAQRGQPKTALNAWSIVG